MAVSAPASAPPPPRTGAASGRGPAGAGRAPVRVAAPASSPAAAALIRGGAFVALAIYCTQQWAGQVAPPGRWPALAAVALAAALAALALASRDWALRLRIPALAAAVLLAVALVLLSCGVPLHLLRPGSWAELASGIGQGLGAVPQLRVPYRGADEWIRTVVLTGGGLLVLLAALAGFCGRRRAPGPATGRRGATLPGSPLAAAAVLGLAYAVPVIARSPEHPFGSGAVLALLLAALLWADRLEPARAPAAVALAVAAVLAALALAPRIDGGSAWIDVESLAGADHRTATAFDWDHTYSALNWPRQGTEALRIDAPSAAYWKGVTLTQFDGLRWTQDRYWHAGTPDTQQATARRDWYQDIRVVARGIDSAQLYAPGEVLDIKRLGRDWESGPGGTAATVGRHLRPGDSYVARVYAPRPNTTDMQGAGTDYPVFTREDLAIEIPLTPLRAAPAAGPDPSPPATTSIEFRAFGRPGPPQRVAANGTYPDGATVLAHSDYGRLYRLARRLRAQAVSPYDLVQRVSRRVQRGATYTELPPQARVPLDDFVFGSRQGYCQEFSGATALLLRMAGVPARVASGFAPGTYDRTRHEYVVRDLDAHSWVEVYFPHIGWVPFDPTPASAPPASQSSLADGDPSFSAPSPDKGAAGKGDAVRGASAAAAGGGGGGASPLGIIGALAAAGLATCAGVAVRRQRTRGGDADAELPALAELRRALQRSGRSVAPGTTLRALEQRFAGSPEAEAYLRALRLERYAAEPPGAPTGAGRAALRRELGSGLGLRGRLRAWWALPPRRPGRGAVGAAAAWLRGGRRRFRAL
jgi:protein-glutamine gamma-glutamyltransferase